MKENNSHNKAKFLGIFVNVIEWYDYALYIYLASIIAELYFPNNDRLMSLISSYAVFAAGFIARPVGAWIFGYIGDYYSRKKALFCSLIMMSIPSSLMLFIPSFEKWGYFSSISILLIRICQGVAVGGNYGGGFVFTIEHARKGTRGITGGLGSFATFSGFLLGSIVCSTLTNNLDKQDLYDWGWRMPFLFSIFSLLIAFYLGSQVSSEEKPNSKELSPKESIFSSISKLYSSHPSIMLRAITIICLDAVGIYILFFFYKLYLEEIIGMEIEKVYNIHDIGMNIMIIFAVFFGWLSDKIGRKPILLMVSLSFIITPYIGFNLVKHHPEYALLVQLVFALTMGACYGALPAFIVELFPRSIRYSGCSLAFNLSMCIFGGTSTIFALWLIKITNNVSYVALYLSLIGLLSIIALSGIKDKYQQEID